MVVDKRGSKCRSVISICQAVYRLKILGEEPRKKTSNPPINKIFMESTVYRGVLIVRTFDDRKMRKVDKVVIPSLSQPNNNHKPNNKTTITVVGMRLRDAFKIEKTDLRTLS